MDNVDTRFSRAEIENETATLSSDERSLVTQSIGRVSEVAGSSSKVILNAAAITALQTAVDPCLAAAGQIGTQIKVHAGGAYLIANVRSLREGGIGELVAALDWPSFCS